MRSALLVHHGACRSRAEGLRCSTALKPTLAHLRVGAEFGARAGRSFVTKFGFDALEREVGGPVVNDEPGLTTFRSNPRPRFVSVGARAVRHASQEQLE